MANAKHLRWGPNATYIPPACVAGDHGGGILAFALGVTQISSFLHTNMLYLQHNIVELAQSQDPM